jgi:hypothetical protein
MEKGIDPDNKYYQNTFIAYDNERRVQQHQILEIENEDFRNSVGTMDETGKRKWIFPRKPKGKYTNYRNYTSYALLAFSSDYLL